MGLIELTMIEDFRYLAPNKLAIPVTATSMSVRVVCISCNSSMILEGGGETTMETGKEARVEFKKVAKKEVKKVDREVKKAGKEVKKAGKKL